MGVEEEMHRKVKRAERTLFKTMVLVQRSLLGQGQLGSYSQRAGPGVKRVDIPERNWGWH